MKKINIRRLYYKIRHDYLNANNLVILVAMMIAAGFVWGSLNVMQRNYGLQRELDEKQRQLLMVKLDYENAKLEQRYYNTNEYKELAVRQRLGLAAPGEHVLILPANSDAAKALDKTANTKTTVATIKLSNFQQWLNFLSGTDLKSN